MRPKNKKKHPKKAPKSTPPPTVEESPGSLPSFSSMQQCSEATGIPVSVLKKAKRHGCTGFRWSRIYPADVLKWYFGQCVDDSVDYYTERALKEKAIREQEEVKALEAKRSVIGRADVASFIRTTFAPVREDVVSLAGLLAAKCNPQNPALAREVLAAWADQFIARRREQLPEEVPHA